MLTFCGILSFRPSPRNVEEKKRGWFSFLQGIRSLNHSPVDCRLKKPSNSSRLIFSCSFLGIHPQYLFGSYPVFPYCDFPLRNTISASRIYFFTSSHYDLQMSPPWVALGPEFPGNCYHIFSCEQCQKLLRKSFRKMKVSIRSKSHWFPSQLLPASIWLLSTKPIVKNGYFRGLSPYISRSDHCKKHMCIRW